jgi:hypothetical protein
MFSEKIGAVEKKHKLTKASFFIREMLGYSPSFYGVNFFNCYIDIDTRSMHIVFKKPIIDKNYHIVKEDLQRDPEFISYISNDIYEIFNLKVPKIYEADFLKFINGKYSEFSKGFKEHITGLHLHTNRITYKFINDIIFPSEEKRISLAKRLGVNVKDLPNNEVFDVPNLEDETFNLNEFIN